MEILLPLTILLSFFFGIIVSFLKYLQKGSSKIIEVSQKNPSLESEILKQIDQIQSVFSSEIKILRDKFETISDSINAETKTTSDSILTEKERENLISSIMAKAVSGAANNVIDEIRHQIGISERHNHIVIEASAQLHSSVFRLKSELESLSRRGNLNLALGGSMTVIGLILLGFFVVSFPSGNSWERLVDFIPRISLVVFIEVFAYFFLKLYKESLAETKYVQNELTNIESKATALLSSVYLENEKVLAIVIGIFALTERNNVLKKGQTTLELEKCRIENEKLSDLLKGAASVVQNVSGKSAS